MANKPFYKQKVFIPIYIGVFLFILAVLNGLFGWVDFEQLRPYLTW